MTDSTTALKPVTFVRDLEPGPVFIEGSKNKLWKTEDGRYLASSWVAGTYEGRAYAETLVYVSDEDGAPENPAVYWFTGPNLSMAVEGPEPMHEAALEQFGYKAVTE